MRLSFVWLHTLLLVAAILLPLPVSALEQLGNANFTGSLASWTRVVTNAGYEAADCLYDGTVGDISLGSVRAYIHCKKGNKPDGSMVAVCYQNLFSGNVIASAANVEVSISNFYRVVLPGDPSPWSITINGGIYNSGSNRIGNFFREENYNGTAAVNPRIGPFRPATWTEQLPAGESYTLSLSSTLYVDPDKNQQNEVHHWFDRVYCNVSPSGLRVTENAASIRLSWLPSIPPAGVPQLLRYNIYRSTTPGGPWGSPIASTTNVFFDDNPVTDTTYYCITDVDTSGRESPKSVECVYKRTRIVITQVSSPKTSVTQGQGGVPVTVTLMNPGPSDISFGGASLTFKIPAVGQYNWTRTSPAIGSTIPRNGGTLNVTFSVDILASSTPDTDKVDATATGTNSITAANVYDNAADLPHSWLIRSPAKLRVLSVTTPSTVYLGQTGVPVDVLVENEGDDNAAALWDLTTLKFSWGSYLNIVPQTTLPIEIYAGQASSVRYLLEIDPNSATGAATIDAWLKFRDANLLIPSLNNDGALFKGAWTIVAGFVNTYKDAAKFIPKDSFNVGTYTVYARAENLMPLKEHRMRWYEPENPVPVKSSNPAITTDNTGKFDDELNLTALSKTGTWRVTCTRVFDSIILAENFFEVGNPASLTLGITLPNSVSLGQTFTATVTVTNIGSATTVDVETATMTMATGGASWLSGPTPVRQDITGESSKSYQLSWQAAALGNLSLRCAAFGFDDNVIIDPKIWAATSTSNVCVVQTPPNLTITSLTEVYESVSRGQENLIVNIRVANSGQADAIFDAASLTHTLGGPHSEIVVSPATGTRIPGGGYLDICYHADIAPLATLGTDTIRATVRGYDANNPTAIVAAPASGTGVWQVLAMVGVLSTNDSTYQPEQYAYTKGQQIYCKFTGALTNRYYRIYVYDDAGDPVDIENGPAMTSGNFFAASGMISATTEVTFNFNTTAAGNNKFHTWRVDIRQYKLAGANYSTDGLGLVGRLYFENKQPGYLTGELNLTPDPVEVGATVTVTLLVSNPVASGSTIATVTPTLPSATSGSTGALTYLSGPVPATADITPGFPATFTWYYRAQTITGLTPASYSMIATFTGTDLNNGTATSGSDVSNSIIIAQRQLSLASTTIDFGDMKVNTLKWVGPSAVVNSGNVGLTNVTWRPSHLIHTNGYDQIHRSYVTFSPDSDFAIPVSSSQPASFSLRIPINQPSGEYTVFMDAFDDYYIKNYAREAEEPYASFTVRVNVVDTEIVDVNETIIDLGNWPQGSLTTTQTVSALNLGNVNLSILKFEEVDHGGLDVNTILSVLPAGPQALATDGLLLASVSADVDEFQPPGVYITTWRLYEDNVALEASDTFQVRIGIGDMFLEVAPTPIDMGNGTPTYTITDVPFTIKNTGELDLTKLKLLKGDLTDGAAGLIPGENIIPEIPAVISPGNTEAATMSLYIAAGVPFGDYSGGQTMYEDLNSNNEFDTDEPFFNFVLNVHVNEYRAIQVLAGTIDFGGRVPGEVGSITFQIKNIGSVDLVDLQWMKVDLVEDIFSNVLTQSWYEFQPIPTPFSLAVGELFNAIGSITINTGQADGNYVGNPTAVLFDDKTTPGVFDIVDDPYDSFNVLCQVGGKSLEILTDPVTISAAEPGSISGSSFFEVKNTGKLLLVKATASATTNLTSGGNFIPASACSFNPNVFAAMNSGQTKSAHWSVDVPPGTNAGVYTGTLLVWNDDNANGSLDPLEASDTATLEIEVASKRIIRVTPNPADLGFVPAGQTGSITVSIYNDGNIHILNNIRLHAVALNPVASGPTPISGISMAPAIASNNLATGTMVNASIQVVVPVGQTGYPYSSEQVMFIDDNGDGIWNAGEPGATFTLGLTVGQKLLSVSPSLIDFGTITAVGPHNKIFSVKNETNIALSYGSWDEISPLTKGTDIIPSSCLEFSPVNFTVGSGATKSDCIASLTLNVASWPQGVYIGTYTAFEDDNGNGVADGFEASDTFQVRLDIGAIGALDILAVSQVLPLDAGTLDQGGSTGIFNVSYQNTGNVALNNLVWNNTTLFNGGNSISSALVIFSAPDTSLTVGEISSSTVQIGPCGSAQAPGIYMSTQYLYDTVRLSASDSFTLMCEVVVGSVGPEVASGSVYQEVATLTWTPPGATWIMSAWVSLDDTASAAIRLLEVDADGNQAWRGIEIDSSGGLTASGTSGSGVVLSSNSGSRTWHRVYFSFPGPDLAIASNTYMVLQNTTEHTASQSVFFDGVQLEKAGDGQTRPAPYTSDKILVSPNRKQTLDGKYRYNEW